MAELHVLRVFCGPGGEGGNRLGVFLDGGEVGEWDRQSVAAELGFAETAFVEDRDRARIRIHTPAVELPFAGHPCVGTAWLLRECGVEPKLLRIPAGELPVRFEGGDAHVAARAEWSLPFVTPELSSPAEIESLDGPPQGEGCWYPWAWIDRGGGTIRTRSFVPAAGVPEDEATGSAAVVLCARLGRPLEIHQGRSSIIHARPADDGMIEIAGASVLEEVREHPL